MADTPDDWADLPFFLAIARTGSFRAAAESLGTTHATVRRRLGTLEEAFGTRLFDRSVDGLALTGAGAEILPRAEAAEREVRAARRQLHGLDQEASGQVRLTVSPSLAFSIMPPILADFAKAYPEIELEIVVTNRFQDLARHETDVAIRVAYEVDGDFVGRRVVQYAKGIYASKDYIERVFPHRGPNGEGLTFIGWGEEAEVPEWLTNSPFPKADLSHKVREGVMVTELLRQGLGMSYMPCYVEDIHPDLARVPGTEAVLDRSIWLLLHADLRRVARVRLFVDFLAEQLRARRKMFLGPLA